MATIYTLTHTGNAGFTKATGLRARVGGAVWTLMASASAEADQYSLAERWRA